MKRSTVIVFLFILSCLMAHTSFSQDLESPQYRMQVEEVTIESSTGGSCSNGVCTPGNKLGKSEKELLSSQGYSLKYGYLSSSSIKPVVVSLSHSQLNLSDKNSMLTITFQGEPNLFYQVTGLQEEPLHTLSGIAIAPTHCDKNCTEKTAQPWKKSTSYGFGYTMIGNQVPFDFKQGKQFRRFSQKGKDDEVILMSNVYNGAALTMPVNQSSLRLKLNRNQPEGSYETIINLTALPSY